jgi:S-adenosylmethionine hydrolase
VAGIITLTTDWNNSDYYTGAVKAKVLSSHPDTNFVDITHNIEAYSISQAAFILKSVYNYFPIGTIHIIAVDSEPDKNGRILIIKHNGHYFILNDNGTAGILFNDSPEITVIVETGSGFKGASFTTLNIFCDIATFILKNEDISKIGTISTDYKKFPELLPQLEPNLINGEIIYIDSYGNAITNISKEIFDENANNSKFEILINSNLYKSKIVYNSYKEVEKGEIVCLFNSLGLLEIAIREGNASQLLSLKRKSEIRVKYNI